MIILKTLSQIDGISKSCRIVAHVLSKLEKEIKPGISTEYLNVMAEELCYERGGIPGFKGYKGFPYAICSSINNEVVHGFPSNHKLKSGEIISIDFGVLYKGWYGDSAITVGVGKIDKNKTKLLSVGQECLNFSIKEAYPNKRLGDISSIIQQHAENNGYNVSRDFVGHGIGKNLHEEPQIPNYGKCGSGYMLKPGMVIAIEPIIFVGSYDTTTSKNGWTVKSRDNKLSAHYEHTIVITATGNEILTERTN